MDDKFIPYFFTPVFVWIVFTVELWHWLTKSPPHVAVALMAAVGTTIVSVIALMMLVPQMRRLNRGERGELETSDALDDLRAHGYKIVHDVVGDGFNVDHVVVGPSGVYAVETKFRSSSGEITFRNGEGLFIGGKPDERNCLKQARWNARSINQMIQERCGLYQWVKPVVVFTGNVKIRDEWSETDLRVFTPAKAARYIAAQQPELMRREIIAIAAKLEETGKR